MLINLIGPLLDSRYMCIVIVECLDADCCAKVRIYSLPLFSGNVYQSVIESTSGSSKIWFFNNIMTHTLEALTW